MAEFKFEPGDIVAARSGGPRMTVETATEQEVKCIWWPQVAGSAAQVGGPVWASEPISEKFPPVSLALLEREGDEEPRPRQITNITIQIGRLNHHLDISRPLADQVADILRGGAEGVA